MAAEEISEGAHCHQGSSEVNKIVHNSKRRRFQDDNGELSQFDDDVKKILAKELADYLDRATEEVEICSGGDEDGNIKAKKEPVYDFQLFSVSHQKALETLAKEKQNCHQEDIKASSSSDDEDDQETEARLKEAAVSVQDILGSRLKRK